VSLLVDALPQALIDGQASAQAFRDLTAFTHERRVLLVQLLAGASGAGALYAAGITTAMASCIGLQQMCVVGGASTMWDMDRDWISVHIMKSILTTFLDQGGQIFQGNMTYVAELKRAVEHPEEYPHLLVRVGGHSARLTSLSSVLQQEIIHRYRHGA